MRRELAFEEAADLLAKQRMILREASAAGRVEHHEGS
jgi:hypothetical protein